jgi:hypothetical protein
MFSDLCNDAPTTQTPLRSGLLRIQAAAVGFKSLSVSSNTWYLRQLVLQFKCLLCPLSSGGVESVSSTSSRAGQSWPTVEAQLCVLALRC